MNPTRCRHLRSKQMYVTAQADPAPAEDPEFASGSARHYWCNRTLTEAGPDDRPVHADLCSESRSCCEA